MLNKIRNIVQAKNKSIRVLNYTFDFIAVLLLTIVGVAIYGLSDLHKTIVSFTQNEHVYFESLFSMQYAARERSLILNQIINEKDEFTRDELILQFYSMSDQFAKARRKLLALDIEESEKNIFEKQRLLTNKIVPLQHQVIQLSLSGQTEKAKSILFGEAMIMQSEVVALLEEALGHELDEAKEKAGEVSNDMVNAILLLVLCAILISLLMFAINRYSKRQISQLLSEIQDAVLTVNKLDKTIENQQVALNAHDIVSIADVKGKIIYANDKFCEISQYTQEELNGKTHAIVKSDYHDAAFFKELWKTIANGKIWEGEICNRSKDGNYYWVKTTIVPFMDDKNKPYQYVGIRTDITAEKNALEALNRNKHELEEIVARRTQTIESVNASLRQEIEERKKLEIELNHSIVTDALTGIYNRKKFDDTCEFEIKRSERYGIKFSLILLDIDHFKKINDQHGHQVGDKVLQKLVEIVNTKIRDTDVFARWGGEEFVIIANNCCLSCSVGFSERLRETIELATFPNVGTVTCSIGVAEYQKGDKLDSLLERTDQALYNAKRAGRDQVYGFVTEFST